MSREDHQSSRPAAARSSTLSRQAAANAALKDVDLTPLRLETESTLAGSRRRNERDRRPPVTRSRRLRCCSQGSGLRRRCSRLRTPSADAPGRPLSMAIGHTSSGSLAQIQHELAYLEQNLQSPTESSAGRAGQHQRLAVRTPRPGVAAKPGARARSRVGASAVPGADPSVHSRVAPFRQQAVERRFDDRRERRAGHGFVDGAAPARLTATGGQ